MSPDELAALADGTVVRWRQGYRRAGQTYRFAAVKASGEWWLTDGGKSVTSARLARRLAGKAGMRAASEFRVIDEGGW